MRRLAIDTDTASDDAVALLLALGRPDVRVEAITVVAGNVPLSQAVQNALYTVELAGAATPVHAGRDRPLLVPLGTAQHVHGADGMGDIGLPLAGREPAGDDAVAVLLELARRHAGELELVTLGPLTNVAAAILADPGFAGRIRRCTVMGGAADHIGNVTALAEYNVWADPHAARIVFDAGLPLTMVGWDISRRHAVIDRPTAARLRALGPLGAFAMDINAVVDAYCVEVSGLAGFDLPDPIAMAVALEPGIATEVRHLNVTIETESPLCRGASVVQHAHDPTDELRPPNADVVLAASTERFLAVLEAALARVP